MSSKLVKAKELWSKLGDIPTDDNERIDEDFVTNTVTFEKGTDVYYIWHWFEETFDVSVAENLMFGGDDVEEPADKVKRAMELQLLLGEFYILSPDGFTLTRDQAPFDNVQDAYDALCRWVDGYRRQGYYRNNRQEKIMISELPSACSLSSKPYQV